MKKKYIVVSIVMIFTVILSLTTLGSYTAFAESRTVTLQVKNMTCGVCTYTVKKSLKKVPGVTDAKVTLDPPQAIVTFDETKATVEDLTQATGQAGYPSVSANDNKK